MLDLDTMVMDYLTAIVWTESDQILESDGVDIVAEDYEFDKISRLEAVQDCGKFLVNNWDDCQEFARLGYSVGHDLWLTRQGHGAGFWDRGTGMLGERLTNAAHELGEVAEVFISDNEIVVI